MRPWARLSTTCMAWQSMRSERSPAGGEWAAFQEGQRSPSLVCAWRDLGGVEYGEAFELQRKLVEQRKRGEIPDQLVIVEHPHTITLGRNGHLENLLAHEEALSGAGIAFHHTDRGGDITYH